MIHIRHTKPIHESSFLIQSFIMIITSAVLLVTCANSERLLFKSYHNRRIIIFIHYLILSYFKQHSFIHKIKINEMTCFKSFYLSTCYFDIFILYRKPRILSIFSFFTTKDIDQLIGQYLSVKTKTEKERN